MKKVLMGCLIAAIFMACESKPHRETSSVQDLASYVDSVNRLDEGNVSSNWSTIEKRYKTKLEQAAAADKSEEEKTSLAESKAKYKKFRAKYTSESLPEEVRSASNSDAVKPEGRRSLRNVLFGEGKIGTDMNFKWVTAKNIRQVYEHFVHSVKVNKDNFSREDWDEIKVLYEALDSRKNEVEKDLSDKDNLAIAKQKVEFAAYKTIERPLAKGKENREAKKEGGK